MGRSTKKGPYIDEKLMKKVQTLNKNREKKVIKTWARACTVTPEFVGHSFAVHNGNKFINVFVTEEMVGHRLGEFALTRKFVKHGGKMQKELETKQKEAEIAAAQTAKTTPSAQTAAAPTKK